MTDSTRRDEVKKKTAGWLETLDVLLANPKDRKTAFSDISELSEMDVSSFQKAYKKLNPQFSSKTTFTPEEEDIIEIVCILKSKDHQPFNQKGLCLMAKCLFDVDVGRKWAYGFLERHKETLSFEIPKPLSPIRARVSIVEETEHFIACWSILVKAHRITDQNLFVFDETRIGRDFTRDKRVSASGLGNPHQEIAKGQVFCTYVPFSRPDGSTPFRVYIFRKDEKRNNANDDIAGYLEPKHQRDCVQRLYLTSPTGYMTLENFRDIMAAFHKWWSDGHGSTNVFLLSDNLPAHANGEIVNEYYRKNVFMYNIMPGSSHWFQVHDSTPFASLKNLFYKEIDSISFKHDDNAKVRNQLVGGCFYKAEMKAFSRETVKKAFDNVGLFPFQPEKILDHARREQASLRDAKNDEKAELLKKALDAYDGLGEERRASILSLVTPTRPMNSRPKITPEEKIALMQPKKKCKTGKNEECGSGEGACQKGPDVIRCDGDDKVQCCHAGCERHFKKKQKWDFCEGCNSAWCGYHKHNKITHVCTKNGAN